MPTTKFANNVALGRAVKSLAGREVLQRELEKLEKRAMTNQMRIEKENCQNLHLEWRNAACVYRLENE